MNNGGYEFALKSKKDTVLFQKVQLGNNLDGSEDYGTDQILNYDEIYHHFQLYNKDNEIISVLYGCIFDQRIRTYEGYSKLSHNRCGLKADTYLCDRPIFNNSAYIRFIEEIIEFDEFGDLLDDIYEYWRKIDVIDLLLFNVSI